MPPRSRTSAGKAAKAPDASKAGTHRHLASTISRWLARAGRAGAGADAATTGLSDPPDRPTRPRRAAGPSADRRATALTPASIELLGLPADWLAAKGQRIGSMVVDAGLAPALNEDESLRLGQRRLGGEQRRPLCLSGRKYGSGRRFRAGRHRIDGQVGQRRLEMVGRDAVGARLVIAADGRNSTLRREDGIQRQQQDFGQIALTGVIRHETPHGAARSSASCAVAPLPCYHSRRMTGEGYASSFIWVEPSATAKGLFALEPSILIERMQSRFGDALGRLSKTDNEDWGQFPLLAHSCDRIIGERLALIGEAAHSIHPLAGQGLNLSIKDAAALTDALIEQRRYGLDPGDAQTLERYQRARRAETARMSGLTTGLNGLFSRPGRPLRAAAARWGCGRWTGWGRSRPCWNAKPSTLKPEKRATADSGLGEHF